MSNDIAVRGVVVDTNVWLDATAHIDSTTTERRHAARRALAAFNRRVILDGEPVQLFPIVPTIVVREITSVLRRHGKTEAEIKTVQDQVRKATNILGGNFDIVEEDRAEMARRSWLYHGTGAADEMVLTAAKRNGAAILTADGKSNGGFLQYCGDRQVAAFTPEGLVEALAK